MNRTLKLPNFAPQPPVAFEQDGDGTVIIHLRPTAYGVASGDLAIRVDGRTLELLLEQDCLLFGARAGHLIVASSKNLKSTRRLHQMLTAAPPEYECLYRDGNAANVTVANIGVRTRGGYAYWIVPQDGETDPAWNTEGQLMRAPGAIKSRRPVRPGDRPLYLPLPHRKSRSDVAFYEELDRGRSLRTVH